MSGWPQIRTLYAQRSCYYCNQHDTKVPTSYNKATILSARATLSLHSYAIAQRCSTTAAVTNMPLRVAETSSHIMLPMHAANIAAAGCVLTCHVPRLSRPLLMGMLTLLPNMDALQCAADSRPRTQEMHMTVAYFATTCVDCAFGL
jgi:hypothetical protein